MQNPVVKRRVGILTAIAVWFGAAPALGDTGSADRFYRYWSDGQAELSGYDLIQPRYGQPRHGRAVLIFVTEPYSRARRVKVDRYDPKDPDQVVVLKLNHQRKFQTGIYDYSVMTSVFADPTAGFRPLEVNFSSQEWCGHVYEEMHLSGDQAKAQVISYFEGESQAAELALGGAIAEDNLLILARSLASESLERKEGPARMLGSALLRRLRHLPLEVYDTKLIWSQSPKEVKVPAGAFTVHELDYGRQDGTRCAMQIEVPYPHRVIGWRCADGERAELTGSTRLPYWKTNQEGDERRLTEMGLSPMDMAP